MSPPSSSAAVLPLSWASVLDKVAVMLRAAEAETLRSEQALDTARPRLAAEADSSPACLDRLQERLAGMQDALARAEQVTVTAEGACRQAEEAFADWLARADAARRKLATTAAAAV